MVERHALRLVHQRQLGGRDDLGDAALDPHLGRLARRRPLLGGHLLGLLALVHVAQRVAEPGERLDVRGQDARRAERVRVLRVGRVAGVDERVLILDPGFGFGWTPEQNLEIVRRLPELWAFQLPLLLGPSRKSTIGFVLNAPVDERFEGTAALAALGAAAGADILRVHDVAAMRRVLTVADAVVRANWRYRPDGG